MIDTTETNNVLSSSNRLKMTTINLIKWFVESASVFFCLHCVVVVRPYLKILNYLYMCWTFFMQYSAVLDYGTMSLLFLFLFSMVPPLLLHISLSRSAFVYFANLRSHSTLLKKNERSSTISMMVAQSAALLFSSFAQITPVICAMESKWTNIINWWIIYGLAKSVV